VVSEFPGLLADYIPFYMVATTESVRADCPRYYIVSEWNLPITT